MSRSRTQTERKCRSRSRQLTACSEKMEQRWWRHTRPTSGEEREESGGGRNGMQRRRREKKGLQRSSSSPFTSCAWFEEASQRLRRGGRKRGESECVYLRVCDYKDHSDSHPDDRRCVSLIRLSCDSLCYYSAHQPSPSTLIHRLIVQRADQTPPTDQNKPTVPLVHRTRARRSIRNYHFRQVLE